MALENLLQACRNNRVAFCGFAWGIDPPMLMRFGNVKEQGPDFTELLLKLANLAKERQEQGLVVSDPLNVQKTNSLVN
jgi:RNase H-fold protein (predicted Holliday junction resolvase)